MDTLNKIVVVQLDVHLCGGRRKLQARDINVSDDIANNDVVTLGAKKYIDPKDLAPGQKFKKRMERKLREYGVAFLNGCATSEERAAELSKELDSMIGDADAWKRQFIADFDQRVRRWMDRNPNWERQIREAIPDVAEVDRSISFGYRMFHVNSVEHTGEQDGLNRAVTGLAGQLYREVAQDAQHLWETSLKGKERVSRRVLRPLVTLAKKLQGMEFIDPRVGPVADRIRIGIDAMPGTGPLGGNDLNVISGIVLMLADPERMKAHGDGVLGGEDTAAPEETEETPTVDNDADDTPEPSTTKKVPDQDTVTAGTQWF